MINLTNVCLVSLLLTSAVLGQPSATGALQGAVRDEQGNSVAGVSVSYSRIAKFTPGPHGQPLLVPGETVFNSQALSDAQGAFQLAAAPVGDYILCAEIQSAAYLNPCKWGSPARVTIGTSAVASTTLVLKKGVFLKVRINDPMGLLPKTNPGPLHAGGINVGVKFRSGAYVGAQNTGLDSGGRDYQVAIPSDEPVNLWLFSADVALQDAAGKAVDNKGSLILLQVMPGQDQIVSFTTFALAPKSSASGAN